MQKDQDKVQEQMNRQEGDWAADSSKLIENIDYTWEAGGLMVLTAAYLKKRGFCCKNGCRHCPYGFTKK